jgi:hypothetical protein
MRAIEFYVKSVADVILEAKQSERGAMSAKFQEEFVELEDKGSSQE